MVTKSVPWVDVKLNTRITTQIFISSHLYNKMKINPQNFYKPTCTQDSNNMDYHITLPRLTSDANYWWNHLSLSKKWRKTVGIVIRVILLQGPLGVVKLLSIEYYLILHYLKIDIANRRYHLVLPTSLGWSIFQD